MTDPSAQVVSASLLKYLYFATTGSLAPYIKYLPLLLLHQTGSSSPGLSPTNVGYCLALFSLVNFISSTFLLGPSLDRITNGTPPSLRPSKYRAAFLMSFLPNLLIALALLLLYLVPASPPSPLGPLLIPLLALFSLVTVGPSTILETVAILSTKASRTSYGSLRLYGALGWGVCSWLSGIAADELSGGDDELDDRERVALAGSVYGFFLASCLLSMLVVFVDPLAVDPLAPAPPPDDGTEQLLDAADRGDSEVFTEVEEGRVDTHSGQSSESNPILSAPLLLLCSNLLVTGICVSFVESFLFAYISTAYADSTNGFLGLLILVMTLCEVPIFVYSKQIIKKLGIANVFSLSHLCYIGRVYLYTVIPQSRMWMFGLLEPLHAFVFAAMMCAAVEGGREMGGGDDKKQATIQALLRKFHPSP
jgi:hypothetical protein